MSSVNYSLKTIGVRMIAASEAWVKTKKRNYKLNPEYCFVGKVDMSMPNVIVTSSDKRKPHFKGNTCELNKTAQAQMVDHFYDNEGKRNRKRVVYFGVKKGGRK